MRNDPFSLELSKPESMDQRKLAFEVNIVFSEGRGKERTKIKHKHKTVITDKGLYTYPYISVDTCTDLFLFKLSTDLRLLLMIRREISKSLPLIFQKISFSK